VREPVSASASGVGGVVEYSQSVGMENEVECSRQMDGVWGRNRVFTLFPSLSPSPFPLSLPHSSIIPSHFLGLTPSKLRSSDVTLTACTNETMRGLTEFSTGPASRIRSSARWSELSVCR
jgi:hypothetical protein